MLSSKVRFCEFKGGGGGGGEGPCSTPLNEALLSYICRYCCFNSYSCIEILIHHIVYFACISFRSIKLEKLVARATKYMEYVAVLFPQSGAKILQS